MQDATLTISRIFILFIYLDRICENTINIRNEMLITIEAGFLNNFK